MNSNIKHISPNDVALLGVPFDAYSSHLKGAGEAPAAIRRMMLCGSANSSTELGVELKKHPKIILITHNKQLRFPQIDLYLI